MYTGRMGEPDRDSTSTDGSLFMKRPPNDCIKAGIPEVVLMAENGKNDRRI